jgi:NAD(P)-dependent dehydrogenase (short-subunit alcohol dehydrogenase family)
MNTNGELRAATRPLPLAGKSVTITGASRGIGAATAVACARHGAKDIALLGRTIEALALVAERVEDLGANAFPWPCDVTDPLALSRAFAYLDHVDVLVNNAGANRPEPFLAVTPETFEHLWRLNVRAPFFAAQHAARRMIEEDRGGVIIHVSSQMGHVGAALRTVYCATKHALEGMMKAQAVELAPHRIRVVTVAPTFARTDMTSAQLDDPLIGGELIEQIPLGRFATVEEIAETIAWVASPAAGMFTGSALKPDGGWTAR